MLCTCQNAQINNARQLRLHYPRRRSSRGREGWGGGIRIWNANKNFESKGRPAEATATATKGLESSRRSSGTRTIRTMVACRQKPRQGKRRRCHHSVHYCRLYCRSPPSLSHSPDRPAPAPTVIILMTTVIVLFLSPLCARRCKSTSEFTRSPSLSLSLFPSLSVRFTVQTDARLAKNPWPRSEQETRQRSSCQATNAPANTLKRALVWTINVDRISYFSSLVFILFFFWKLICAACCLL